MAEMNQLLDEAAQGCAELAARAETSASAAHDLVEQAQALGTRALDDGERLHHEYGEAITAIQQAANHAGHSIDAAARVVETVPQEALDAARSLQTMLTAAGGSLSQLAQERVRVFHELDETARQAETGFHDLAARMQIYAEHVDARLDEAAAQLGHLQSVGKGVADGLGKAQHDLHEELTDLGRIAAKVTEATAHALEQMLSAVANGVVDFANNAISDHNQLMAAARQGFLEETKDEPDPDSTYVNDAFDKVHDALGRVDAVLDPGHAALQTSTTACLDAGEKAVNDFGGGLQDLDRSVQQVAP